jgi:alpha 1,3-mannosyltransferase
VCSFTIAHPDAIDKTKLLWYNGSLLRNKAMNATEFTVPQYWMTDATWYKGASKPDMSCMAASDQSGGEVRVVEPGQVRSVQKSVELARKIDQRVSDLIDL